MKRPFQFISLMACLLAVFLSAGGHWAVLQSVAWARMLADFSRTDSWRVAVAKTFDGEHPCPMCLKIREGRARESKPPAVVKFERLPEFAPQASLALLSPPEIPAPAVIPFVPHRHADFISPPQKPPPRAV
jgi:hypothetical protein